MKKSLTSILSALTRSRPKLTQAYSKYYGQCDDLPICAVAVGGDAVWADSPAGATAMGIGDDAGGIVCPSCVHHADVSCAADG